MLDRLDFWVLVFSLGAAVYFLLWKDFLEPKVKPLITLMSSLAARWRGSRRTTGTLERSDEIPRSDASEQSTHDVQSVQEHQDLLILNAQDREYIARMILHNRTALKLTKGETIYAACGKTRGGSTEYQRCSLLYDALFVPPLAARFPAITKQRAKQRTA